MATLVPIKDYQPLYPSVEQFIAEKNSVPFVIADISDIVERLDKIEKKLESFEKQQNSYKTSLLVIPIKVSKDIWSHGNLKISI